MRVSNFILRLFADFYFRFYVNCFFSDKKETFRLAMGEYYYSLVDELKYAMVNYTVNHDKNMLISLEGKFARLAICFSEIRDKTMENKCHFELIKIKRLID